MTPYMERKFEFAAELLKLHQSHDTDHDRAPMPATRQLRTAFMAFTRRSHEQKECPEYYNFASGTLAFNAIFVTPGDGYHDCPWALPRCFPLGALRPR